MKDFIFRDVADSRSMVVFRTDLINGDNFTIHTIDGLDTITENQTKKKALLQFLKVTTTKQDLIAFALEWELDLVVQESDGSESVTLVDDDSDSDAGSW